MRLQASILARLGLFCLVLAVTGAVVSAQSSGYGTANKASEQGVQDKGSVIPGTGVTGQELRQIGYSDREIAMLMDEANSSEMQAGSNKAGSSATEPAASDINKTNRGDQPDKPQEARANAGTDSGKYGLWGLLGLFGLAGLAGRGRREVSRPEERDRDIRRVA
jgi:MYXO-CTERM domain-containing protein